MTGKRSEISVFLPNFSEMGLFVTFGYVSHTNGSE